MPSLKSISRKFITLCFILSPKIINLHLLKISQENQLILQENYVKSMTKQKPFWIYEYIVWWFSYSFSFAILYLENINFIWFLWTQKSYFRIFASKPARKHQWRAKILRFFWSTHKCHTLCWLKKTHFLKNCVPFCGWENWNFTTFH